MFNPSIMNDSVEHLRSGDVIVTPSESCYGFSCDATNPSAVAKLNTLKQRQNIALTLLVNNLSQIETFGILNNTARQLSHAFHPGPLNIIIEMRDPEKFSYLSPNGIAFRIPDNKILQDLIAAFGKPITTTSANLHGQRQLYKYDEVVAQFGHKVAKVIDAGDLDSTSQTSTVYDSRTGTLLREGPITKAQIDECLANP